MNETMTEHNFFKTGKKLGLLGILITAMGAISISIGTISRMIFTPIIPIYPDHAKLLIIFGVSLIVSGSIINYITMRWIKKETQKIQDDLKNNKKIQELEKIQKTTKDYMEHFGYQLQKGGISFTSLAILTLTYAWIAAHDTFRTYISYNIYTNYDIYVSLIIVTASLAVAATLLIYGEYWKNKAKKQK
ncbi:MAG: hypothetical protein QXO71_03620 [Candidatus Jordarchaeaceae archaeon]